ncbi:uncharacterized protein N7483_007819 [Penicillium malachiteum]|uniref:uncharacterized protein n=1 Tax=Penicillium malachiteum TaxID=1324776 RepID=UPI0025477A0C|nr:uncharacterized protein N7483_007819 [Penicillium malachiteum]KAJ5726462.1 hypothetical protein N7483_007819 [Penicillium malachiteum]
MARPLRCLQISTIRFRKVRKAIDRFHSIWQADQIIANKAQAAKVLKELHRKKKIEERTAVVYHAIQDSSQSVTPEDIATLNESIENLQNELTTIKTDDKKVRATLASFEGKPLLSDLRQDIQRLQEERDTLQERLGDQAASDEVHLSMKERENLENEWKEWQRHATLRRRMCRDLWGRCTEVLPDNMTLSELWVSPADGIRELGSPGNGLKWLAGVTGAGRVSPMRHRRVLTLCW